MFRCSRMLHRWRALVPVLVLACTLLYVYLGATVFHGFSSVTYVMGWYNVTLGGSREMGWYNVTLGESREMETPPNWLKEYNHNSSTLQLSVPPEVRPYLKYQNHKGTEIPVLYVTSQSGTQSQDTRVYPTWVEHMAKSLYNRSRIPSAKLDFYHRCIERDPPLGSWPQYNYDPLRKLLQPEYQHTAAQNLKIPLVVHFTWFYKKEDKPQKPKQMEFYHMMCLLAAHKKIKPFKILFWYDIMPTGKWWDYAVEHIPNLLMVYRETPKSIFKTVIQIPEHKSDITRLEAVLAVGGVYFDLDSLALNSLHPLRNYSAIQGAPFWYSLANGVLIGAPNNLFHWLLYLSYKFKYNPKDFGGNSVLKGMDLAHKYPHLIHVDYTSILRPNIPERFYFFMSGWLWDWSKHYCVHLYARFNTMQYGEGAVRRRDTVLGEMYRDILHDDPTPGLGDRPTLLQMSWWQHKKCSNGGFPKGLWNCTELARTFTKLNHTYHFHPGWK